MNATAPASTAELQMRRVRLAAVPTAAAAGRGQVLAAIRSWTVPVDADVAVLLTSELVTNAVRHEENGTVTLAIRCDRGRLRVEVHDTSCAMPVPPANEADEANKADKTGGADNAEAEAGRGLMLVASLATDWGFYRTPAGKAVYFTLKFQTVTRE